MTPAQCRAARSLLDWTQPKLAEASALGLSTIVDLERQRRAVSADALSAIRAALEAAGVIFVDENGEGPGVRLRKAKPADVAELTDQIEALDEKIAEFPVAGEPSPQTGMNQLDKALAKNERTKLKNRRTKIKAKEPK